MCMTIKCNNHPSAEAIFLCKSCGFLCDAHLQEEKSLHHSLVVVDLDINMLFDSYVTFQMARAASSIMMTVKKYMLSFLESEFNKCCEKEKEAKEELERCLTKSYIISSKIVCEFAQKKLESMRNAGFIERLFEKIKTAFLGLIQAQHHGSVNPDKMKKIEETAENHQALSEYTITLSKIYEYFSKYKKIEKFGKQFIRATNHEI